MSLKASELRIGNWAQRADGSTFQIDANDILLISKWNTLAPLPEPIPLTEEWVSKFGFQKKYDYDLVITDSLFFTMYEDESDSVYLFKNFINALDYVAKVKYVHKLQNLYFDLTGEELKYEG